VKKVNEIYIDDEARLAYFDQNENLAHSIANSFYSVKQTYVDCEDIHQQALLFLWEAIWIFKEEFGNKFSTFATMYIRNKMVDYFRHINSQKCQGDYNRVDIEKFGNDKDGELENGLESLIADKETSEENLQYNLLKIDIEMQLRNMNTSHKLNKNKKTGIEILGRILMGENSVDIMDNMGLEKGMFNRCLYVARQELKVRMR
jgi:RNA polymerase sigma factor (sigma-70 family)